MATSTGPRLRIVDGLHIREIGDEILVVDTATQQAHTLHGAMAKAFRAVQESTLPSVADQTVLEGASELVRLGLVERRSDLSRRQVLQGATTVAVAGTVMSIHLPAAAAANSTQPVPISSVTLADNTAKNSTPTQTVTLTGNGTRPIDGSITVSVLDKSNANNPQAITLASGPTHTQAGTVANGTIAKYTFSFRNPSADGKAVEVTVALSGSTNYTGGPWKAQYLTGDPNTTIQMQ